MKPTKNEIADELAARKKKAADLQTKTAAYADETFRLEGQLGIASANEDATEVTRLEALLAGRLTAHGRDLLTLSALTDQISTLEHQLASVESDERAEATQRIITTEAHQREKIKATIATLVEDAASLEATWRELNSISGGSRSASASLTIALSIALKDVCPEFRTHIVMHPARNSQFGGFDLYGDMLSQRAERATAPGGRSGEEVAAARAAVQGAR